MVEASVDGDAVRAELVTLVADGLGARVELVQVLVSGLHDDDGALALLSVGFGGVEAASSACWGSAAMWIRPRAW